MTQTQDSKHFSDNQWLEITAKLQKPNAPSKQAIPCEYCVSEAFPTTKETMKIIRVHSQLNAYILTEFKMHTYARKYCT